MEFVLLSPHNDIIHDISFDFYGTRFATCSSDRLIKIWDLKQKSDNKEGSDDIFQHNQITKGGADNTIENGSSSGGDNKENDWTKTEFRAHTDSIWGLTWAHPEFGSVLASCSEDRTICIWEEKEVLTQPAAVVTEKAERWIKRATLSESKKAVTDVKFAPRFLGFLLAATSADGCVRIYEAPDAFSLNYWQLHDTFVVERIVTEYAGRGVLNAGDSVSSSSASSNPALNVIRESEYGLTCIAWSESPIESARVAVGGYSKVVSIWVQDSKTNKWREEVVLDKLTGVVHDIAWAPAMGRSYHQIATASRESSVRIFTIARKDDGSLDYIPSATNPTVLQCDSPVWRVAWNSTGTVLTTSGDDGTLRFFKKDFSGSFKLVRTNQLKG